MDKPKHGDELTFSFAVDLDTLIELNGMEEMNNLMDEEFDKQFEVPANLTDIAYRPVGTDDNDNIIIEATGIVEYMDGDPEELEDACC